MITCNKCGKPVSVNDLYCRYCGQKQDQERNRSIFNTETIRSMETAVKKHIYKYKSECFFPILWKNGIADSFNFRSLSRFGNQLLLLEVELERLKIELRSGSPSYIEKKKRSVEIREEKIDELVRKLKEMSGVIVSAEKSKVPSNLYETNKTNDKKEVATIVLATSIVVSVVAILFIAAPEEKPVSMSYKIPKVYQQETVSCIPKETPIPTAPKSLSLTDEIVWNLQYALDSRWEIVTVMDIDHVRIHICVRDKENDQFSLKWKSETPHANISKLCANIAFSCASKRGGGFWVSVGVKDKTGSCCESYRWREHMYKNGSVTTNGWYNDF